MRGELSQTHHPGGEFEAGGDIDGSHDRMVERDRRRRDLRLGNQRRHGHIDHAPLALARSSVRLGS